MGTRKAFGQPLLNNQYMHFRLAELQTELELFRALTYQAADAMERGEDVTLYASMLKLKCGRLSREITDSCLQFWGVMGILPSMKKAEKKKEVEAEQVEMKKMPGPIP